MLTHLGVAQGGEGDGGTRQEEVTGKDGQLVPHLRPAGSLTTSTRSNKSDHDLFNSLTFSVNAHTDARRRRRWRRRWRSKRKRRRRRRRRKRRRGRRRWRRRRTVNGGRAHMLSTPSPPG